MARRFFWIAAFVLAGQAQAGFCYTPMGDNNIQMPPISYSGNPQKVEWQAFTGSILTDQNEPPQWHATEFFSGGQLNKTVTYANNAKTTETYVYNGSRWQGGQQRVTKVGLADLFKGNTVEQQLDLLDTAAAKKGQGDAISVKYDAQGRPLSYQGHTPATLDTGRFAMGIKCSYPKPNVIIEATSINMADVALYSENKYELDSAKRLIMTTVSRGEDLTAKNIKPYLINKYTYAPDGKKISFIRQTAAGKLVSKGSISLNEKGQLLSFSENMQGPNSSTSWKWKYDTQGNWIETVQSLNNTPTQVIRRTFTY